MAQIVNIDKIVKEALDAHRLNEAIPTPTNAPTNVKNSVKAPSTSTDISSDVENLIKLISSNTALLRKLKTVNNGQKVTDFLSFILNNINDKVTGVQKQKIKDLIDQRFKN
jgi:hypothetical protein